MKWEKIEKDIVLWTVGEALREYKDGALLTVEVKRWKPIRTLTQNAFFHLLVGHLAHEMDMDAGLIKDGIKEKYGYRVSMFGRLVPKPSHLCDRFDEMSALIEGGFREAGEHNPPIDMRDWIRRWEQIRKERANDDTLHGKR